MSAVAFASLRLLGSAPCLSNRRSVDASEYSTANMKGVDPSGPRAFRSPGSSATDFTNACRSPAASASIALTAFTSTGGRSASLASASGHAAPASIHALMTAISSGFNRPVGGIGLPN